MEMLRYPIIALVIGWILGAVFTKLLLPYLEKKQFKQFVREVGPQSHLSKTGTAEHGRTGDHRRVCAGIGRRRPCGRRCGRLAFGRHPARPDTVRLYRLYR